jgi:insulysin
MVDPSWLEDLGSDSAPTVDDVQKYWTDVLAGPGVQPEMAQQLIGQISSLVEKYPVDGEEECVKREGVNYVEDMKAFRTSLISTEPPKPLVLWEELITSKY